MTNLMMQEDLCNQNQEVCSITDCPPYTAAYHNFDEDDCTKKDVCSIANCPTYTAAYHNFNIDSRASGKLHYIQIRYGNSYSHEAKIKKRNKNNFLFGIALTTSIAS